MKRIERMVKMVAWFKWGRKWHLLHYKNRKCSWVFSWLSVDVAFQLHAHSTFYHKRSFLFQLHPDRLLHALKWKFRIISIQISTTQNDSFGIIFMSIIYSWDMNALNNKIEWSEFSAKKLIWNVYKSNKFVMLWKMKNRCIIIASSCFRIWSKFSMESKNRLHLWRKMYKVEIIHSKSGWYEQ